MGILIAFEITFSIQMYYENYRILFFDYHKKNGVFMPHIETTEFKEQMREWMKDVVVRMVLVFFGVGIIIWLIWQTFGWQIDPQNKT